MVVGHHAKRIGTILAVTPDAELLVGIMFAGCLRNLHARGRIEGSTRRWRFLLCDTGAAHPNECDETEAQGTIHVPILPRHRHSDRP